MDEEIALPHAVALAWGIAEQPTRGPKRELSIEAIVSAAMEIADTEGIDAVSMGKVATKLGFTTMSLYRYVTAKEDLLALMEEAALGPAPTEVSASWREGMTALLDAYLAAAFRHPWLVLRPVSALPLTPNAVGWMNWGLTILKRTPLTYDEKLATVLLVNGYGRWEATILTGMRFAAPDVAANYVDALKALVDGETLPELRAALDGGLLEGANVDQFAFGRARVLAGIEALIDDREAVSAGAAEVQVADAPDAAGPTPAVVSSPEQLAPPPADLMDEASEAARVESGAEALARTKEFAKAQVAEAQEKVAEIRRRLKAAEDFVEERRTLGESQIALARQRLAEAKTRAKAAAKRGR